VVDDFDRRGEIRSAQKIGWGTPKMRGREIQLELGGCSDEERGSSPIAGLVRGDPEMETVCRAQKRDNTKSSARASIAEQRRVIIVFRSGRDHHP